MYTYGVSLDPLDSQTMGQLAFADDSSLERTVRDTCTICGYDDSAVNVSSENFRIKT